MTQIMTLTIDGMEVTVSRGATILDAAEKAGVKIPSLCHDKRLTPFGSCRLCMVELKGREGKLIPACFSPARNGMEVITASPGVLEARRTQLQARFRTWCTNTASLTIRTGWRNRIAALPPR